MADEIISGLIGAIAGGAVGAVTSYLQVRRSYRLGIDKELRDARLAAYAKAWVLLKPLSLHGKVAPTPSGLRSLVDQLTAWYYEAGGLYLTSYSQPQFVRLVEALKTVADQGEEKDDPIREPLHRSLYQEGSRFRSHLTLDLRSRDEAAFATRRHKRLRKRILESPGVVNWRQKTTDASHPADQLRARFGGSGS